MADAILKIQRVQLIRCILPVFVLESYDFTNTKRVTLHGCNGIVILFTIVDRNLLYFFARAAGSAVAKIEHVSEDHEVFNFSTKVVSSNQR